MEYTRYRTPKKPQRSKERIAVLKHELEILHRIKGEYKSWGYPTEAQDRRITHIEAMLAESEAECT